MQKLCDSLNWTDVAVRRRDCPHKTQTRQLAVMPSFSFLKESHRLGIVATRRGRDSRSAIARSRRLQPVPYLSAKILTGRGSQKLCRESEFAKSVDMRGNTDESWRRGLEYLLHNYL